jgi:type IV pilus assembly protein PilB
MVAVTVGANLTGLCRAMVTQGLLSPEEGESLQNQSRSSGESFIAHLLRTRRFRADQVAAFASVNFGIPLFNLDALDPAVMPRGAVDPKLLAKHRVLPIAQRGNRLFVALSDPSNLKALDDIKFQTSLATDPIVVEDDKLGRWLESYGEATEESIDIDDAPVVKYIQKILLDAINSGASDIHFEPYEKFYRIRYRTDGVLLRSGPAAPGHQGKDRLPHQGHFEAGHLREARAPGRPHEARAVETRAIDFRVSTCRRCMARRSSCGFSIPSSATSASRCSATSRISAKLMVRRGRRPYGMILVTGPTGSGKTVSLYTCLNMLNKPGINISTAEDPVEINLPGINQVNVNDKAGLTFAAALKAFLRQDPDIIMVGEIRDLETAEIAIKAAQTGHLVLSTLHTNDAPDDLTRA